MPKLIDDLTVLANICKKENVPRGFRQHGHMFFRLKLRFLVCVTFSRCRQSTAFQLLNPPFSFAGFKPIKGETHKERLESFYGLQGKLLRCSYAALFVQRFFFFFFFF